MVLHAFIMENCITTKILSLFLTLGGFIFWAPPLWELNLCLIFCVGITSHISCILCFGKHFDSSHIIIWRHQVFLSRLIALMLLAILMIYTTCTRSFRNLNNASTTNFAFLSIHVHFRCSIPPGFKMVYKGFNCVPHLHQNHSFIHFLF